MAFWGGLLYMCCGDSCIPRGGVLCGCSSHSHCRAREVGELLVGAGAWLVLGAVEVPLVIDVVLLVRAETGRAGELAHRAEVLVQAVLHLVGCGGWRLLLGWPETLRRLRE